MRKTIALVCLAALSSVVSAQKTDRQVNKLINEGKYFELERTYPSVRGEIEDERQRFMADGLTGSYFNRPLQAIEGFDNLLGEYSHEFNFNTVGTLTLLRGINQLVAGLYGDAADGVKDYIRQAEQRYGYESLVYALAFVERSGEALRNYPAPELIRPPRDVKVTVRFKEAGRGEHLMIPVTINGKTRDFVFDTGCSSFNYVSQQFAEEMGIRIIADSIPITGVERGLVKLGFAEQIEVGGIVYKNAVFMVAPRPARGRSALAVDAILGADFMKAVGEFTVYSSENLVVFPVLHLPAPKGGPNMLLRTNQPYVKVRHNDNEILMHFDTGNAKTVFYEAFYQAESAWVRRHGSPGMTRHAGFGGIKTMSSYRLPSIDLKLCDRGFTIYETEVIPDDGGAFESPDFGSLGTDFLRAFHAVTVSYKNMYVYGE